MSYYLQFVHDLEQREACASVPCRSVDSGTGKPCRGVDSGIDQGVHKKHNIATLATFLEAWWVEVPWLVVCKSVSMFTRCSVCEYLRLLIDQTPRDQDELRQALEKNKIGRTLCLPSGPALGAWAL